MRDDQIHNLIQKEVAHQDNLCLLRAQQSKIQLDSIISTLSEPWCLLKMIFNRQHFYKRVNENYTIKAQDYNERMKAAVAREKLKI